MFERYIDHLACVAPGPEESSALLRERLKPGFPAGSTRRMTLLGMMVGATLPPEGPAPDHTIVYSSVYGESPAMEAYLDSFPSPSPTLFQTSIHPSGVQQTLITRRRPIAEFLPFTGSGEITVQAALAAILAPAERVWWCGGDERGSWLREHGAASERSFAFTLGLTRSRTTNSVARLAVSASEVSGGLPLDAWFEVLNQRRGWSGAAGVGWILSLEWLPTP